MPRESHDLLGLPLVIGYDNMTGVVGLLGRWNEVGSTWFVKSVVEARLLGVMALNGFFRFQLFFGLGNERCFLCNLMESSYVLSSDLTVLVTALGVSGVCLTFSCVNLSNTVRGA